MTPLEITVMLISLTLWATGARAVHRFNKTVRKARNDPADWVTWFIVICWPLACMLIGLAAYARDYEEAQAILTDLDDETDRLAEGGVLDV